MAEITAKMVADLRAATGLGMMECKKALVEAEKLGIPVIAVVDTNNSPDGVKYVIPGNDDSAKAIRLYCRGIADAVLEGKNQALQETVAAAQEAAAE